MVVISLSLLLIENHEYNHLREGLRIIIKIKDYPLFSYESQRINMRDSS